MIVLLAAGACNMHSSDTRLVLFSMHMGTAFCGSRHCSPVNVFTYWNDCVLLPGALMVLVAHVRALNCRGDVY